MPPCQAAQNRVGGISDAAPHRFCFAVKSSLISCSGTWAPILARQALHELLKSGAARDTEAGKADSYLQREQFWEGQTPESSGIEVACHRGPRH